MMGLRTTLATVLAVLATTSLAHAQGMRTATGQNPLERISGADYGGSGSLGRTNVSPAYSARYGLQDVNGGQVGQGYNYSPQLSGNGVDPRTGQNIEANRNNPFLYPYTRTPGGNPGGSLASGLAVGVGGGAYYTPNVGSYYQGAGVNNAAWPGGVPYMMNGRAVSGFGLQGGSMVSGQAYPFGISSNPIANASYNPALANYGNLGSVGSMYGGMGAYGGMYGGGLGYGGIGGGYGGIGGGYGYGYGYSPMQNLLPGLVGGAVGALVGRHFGVVGLIAGGVGGFVVGSFLGQQARQMPFNGLYDNYGAMQDTWLGNQTSYYNNLYGYYGQRPTSGFAGPLTGVAGAVLGAMVGKMGGLPGMLIGGVVGFIGGTLISNVLFPSSQYNQGYYNNSYDPYNNLGNFRNGSLPGNLGGAGVTVLPASPNAPVGDDRLSGLREAYFKAVKAMQDAATSGNDAAKRTAEANLKSAEEAYRNAQRAAQ
jgi:hypothetical protein